MANKKLVKRMQKKNNNDTVDRIRSTHCVGTQCLSRLINSLKKLNQR